MLQNARVTSFTVSELFWENQQEVKLPSPILGFKKKRIIKTNVDNK